MSITRRERVSIQSKILRLFWNVNYILLFRPFISPIFRKWRLLILKIWGAKVTWSSSVYASVKIWAPWNLYLAENSGIGPHCIIYNQDKIVLGPNSKISQFCYLCTAGHDIEELNNSKSGLLTGPIIIEENVWIGTNSFINMNIIISKGAIVAASSNVVKNVPSWTIVGGNPAKFIKTRKLKQSDE